jgi:hypothetical protein
VGQAGVSNSAAAKATDSGTEPKTLQDVWESLKAFLLALGDDVQMKELDWILTLYTAPPRQRT